MGLKTTAAIGGGVGAVAGIATASENDNWGNTYASTMSAIQMAGPGAYTGAMLSSENPYNTKNAYRSALRIAKEAKNSPAAGIAAFNALRGGKFATLGLIGGSVTGNLSQDK